MSEGKKIRKAVEDLGVAAYLRMNGYKVAGRKGRLVYFAIAAEDEQSFDKDCFEYLNSILHDFDANLMAIKKMKEYLPNE